MHVDYYAVLFICSLGNFICYAKHLKIILQDDAEINHTANWLQWAISLADSFKTVLNLFLFVNVAGDIFLIKTDVEVTKGLCSHQQRKHSADEVKNKMHKITRTLKMKAHSSTRSV